MRDSFDLPIAQRDEQIAREDDALVGTAGESFLDQMLGADSNRRAMLRAGLIKSGSEAEAALSGRRGIALLRTPNAVEQRNAPSTLGQSV